MNNKELNDAIFALSLLNLGELCWLPIPGTHRLNGLAAHRIIAAIQDGRAKIPGFVKHDPPTDAEILMAAAHGQHRGYPSVATMTKIEQLESALDQARSIAATLRHESDTTKAKLNIIKTLLNS